MAGMVANKTISNSSKLASFTFLTRSFFRAIAHRFQIFWISKNLGHARHMEERTFSFEDSHNNYCSHCCFQPSSFRLQRRWARTMKSCPSRTSRFHRFHCFFQAMSITTQRQIPFRLPPFPKTRQGKDPILFWFQMPDMICY